MTELDHRSDSNRPPGPANQMPPIPRELRFGSPRDILGMEPATPDQADDQGKESLRTSGLDQNRRGNNPANEPLERH
jgi:hypothetical protein